MDHNQRRSSFLRGVLLVGLAISSFAGCAPTSRGEAQARKVEAVRKQYQPRTLVELGKAFATAGDWTRAEQYLSAALDAGVEDATVLPLLLKICVKDGRYRAAVVYAEDAARRHPEDANIRFVLGALYGAMGDTNKARESLEQVLELQPNNAETHFAIASLLHDTHTDPLAMDAHYRAYLKLSPRGSHAEEARGSLLKGVQ